MPEDKWMGKRNRGYYRIQRRNKIRRKRKIIHDQNDYWRVKYTGELSKGKIHCSCPMCRHKMYDAPKIQDTRNFIRQMSAIEDISTEIPVTDPIKSVENQLKKRVRPRF